MLAREILILGSGDCLNSRAIIETALRDNWRVQFSFICAQPFWENDDVYHEMTELGVESYYIPESRPEKIEQMLFGKRNFELIIIDKYKPRLSNLAVKSHRFINIHESLSPIYNVSSDPYSDALNNNNLMSGCTVYRGIYPRQINSKKDFLGQLAFEIPKKILESKDLETLRKIGKVYEATLYPAVVKNQIFRNKINIVRVGLEAGENIEYLELPKVNTFSTNDYLASISSVKKFHTLHMQNMTSLYQNSRN